MARLALLALAGMLAWEVVSQYGLAVARADWADPVHRTDVLRAWLTQVTPLAAIGLLFAVRVVLQPTPSAVRLLQATLVLAAAATAVASVALWATAGHAHLTALGEVGRRGLTQSYLSGVGGFVAFLGTAVVLGRRRAHRLSDGSRD